MRKQGHPIRMPYSSVTMLALSEAKMSDPTGVLTSLTDLPYLHARQLSVFNSPQARLPRPFCRRGGEYSYKYIAVYRPHQFLTSFVFFRQKFCFTHKALFYFVLRKWAGVTVLFKRFGPLSFCVSHES